MHPNERLKFSKNSQSFVSIRAGTSHQQKGWPGSSPRLAGEKEVFFFARPLAALPMAGGCRCRAGHALIGRVLALASVRHNARCRAPASITAALIPSRRQRPPLESFSSHTTHGEIKPHQCQNFRHYCQRQT
jgi:hypothetical protein